MLAGEVHSYVLIKGLAQEGQRRWKWWSEGLIATNLCVAKSGVVDGGSEKESVFYKNFGVKWELWW